MLEQVFQEEFLVTWPFRCSGKKGWFLSAIPGHIHCFSQGSGDPKRKAEKEGLPAGGAYGRPPVN